MSLDRTQAPEFQVLSELNFPPKEQFKLDNGVEVFLFPSAQQEVMSIDLVFHTARWEEEAVGQSWFCNQMLREGTSTMSSNQVSNKFDQKGGFLQLSSGRDIASLSLYCLSKHTDELVQVMAELLYDSTFPEREFDLIQGNKIQEIQLNQEKPSFLASLNFQQKMFGPSHPYGVSMSPEDLNALNPEVLKDFHKRTLSGNMTIILAGNVDKELLSTLNALFGSQAITIKEPTARNKVVVKPEQFLLAKEKQSQSSIRIGAASIDRKHPDYHAFLLMNEYLGGFFGSRLMKNIREDKGYTYGIYSRLAHMKHESYFMISSDVKKEHTQAVFDEIYKEIELLQTQLITNEELELVRNHLSGSLARQFGNAFDLAERFKGLFYQGYDLTQYQKIFNALPTYSPLDIQRVAQEHLNVDNFLEIVVGGRG